MNPSTQMMTMCRSVAFKGVKWFSNILDYKLCPLEAEVFNPQQSTYLTCTSPWGLLKHKEKSQVQLIYPVKICRILPNRQSFFTVQTVALKKSVNKKWQITTQLLSSFFCVDSQSLRWKWSKTLRLSLGVSPILWGMGFRHQGQLLLLADQALRSLIRVSLVSEGQAQSPSVTPRSLYRKSLSSRWPQ